MMHGVDNEIELSARTSFSKTELVGLRIGTIELAGYVLRARLFSR